MIMEKVKEEYYSDFIEFAKSNTCNTVYPMAIAEGAQQGDIYTDDLEKHQYALFWHESGFAYLSGHLRPEGLDAVYALMKNESGNNPRRFVLELNDEQVARYFREKEDIEEHPRYGFRLKKLQPVEEIPVGYELREVDEDLFSRIEGRVVPSNFWNSSKEFITKGRGYCLIKNGEVAAVAFSAAVSSRQIDIGIETREAHRRKGLAVIVAKKMAEYVLSIGKEPVWDCDAANTGSRATAERVGFEVVSQYAYYKFKQ
jgi:RimJ/RimL family protein N-acetyltransferase